MRDLIACRDWYNRDSRCILSRNEICDVINFLAVIDLDAFAGMSALIDFDFSVFMCFFLFCVYDFIIK